MKGKTEQANNGILISKQYSLKGLPRLLWNSPTYTTAGNFVVTSIKGIILYPIVLSRSNENEVAIWLLWISIINLSHMLDMGFVGSFSKHISYVMGGVKSIVLYKKDFNFGQFSTGSPNWPLMEKLYSMMGLIFFGLAVISIGILSTLGTLSVKRVILINTNISELWMAWWFIVLTIGVMIYGRKYRAILHGMNYIPLINRWNILYTLLGIVFSLFAYYIFNSIIAIIVVTQTFVMFTVIRDRYLLKYVVEDKRFSKFKKISWSQECFWPVFSPSWRSAISMVSAVGVVEATGIIYAQVANVKMLTAYLLSLRIMNVMSSISRAPFYSKLPKYARLRAEGKIHELVNTVKRSITISLFTFVLGAISVALFIEPILVMIQADSSFVPISLWLLMANVWFIERNHGMHAQIYGTINHEPFYIPISITGLINIGIIVLFMNQLDVWVFPIAHGISNLIINNWWNVKISLHSLNQHAFKFLGSSFILPFIVFIILQFLVLIILGFKII